MEIVVHFFAATKTYWAFVLIVIFTIIFGSFLGNLLNKKIKQEAQEAHIDVTSFVFLKHALVSVVYFFGFSWAFLTLPITRLFAHSLLAGAGATTLILGFASQQLFTNILSGVALVIRKPFKINDVIEFQGSRGKVVEINLNAIIINDESGDRIIIPSSILLNDKIKIVNSSTSASNEIN